MLGGLCLLECISLLLRFEYVGGLCLSSGIALLLVLE